KGSAPVVFGSELGGLNSIGGVASLASLGGFLAGIQGPPVNVPGINLSLPSFGVVLNALQSSSDVNVISTPNVLLSDTSEGEIADVDKTLGPTTSKRSAKTTVVAKDQETVVIGGLIQERVVKSIQKVPLLGSIPVLGWLFRNEVTNKTKTNLLLFLTPYIIRDQSD